MTAMTKRDELHALATDILTQTMPGSPPFKTVAALAEGVIELRAEVDRLTLDLGAAPTTIDVSLADHVEVGFSEEVFASWARVAPNEWCVWDSRPVRQGAWELGVFTTFDEARQRALEWVNLTRGMSAHQVRVAWKPSLLGRGRRRPR